MKIIVLGIMLSAFCCCGDSGRLLVHETEVEQNSVNLLDNKKWSKYERGFVKQDNKFICVNNDAKEKSGVLQTVVLNQKVPLKIIAAAESKAEQDAGGKSNDYSIYIDISYADGTYQWAVCAPFSGGKHDWQKQKVSFAPAKPVKSLMLYMMYRNRAGKVLFRNIKLYEVKNDLSVNLLDNKKWQKYQKGFSRQGDVFICANSSATEQSGVFQDVILNQKEPFTIKAVAESKAELDDGSESSDYSIYLDIMYADGTYQWAVNMPFSGGKHDWEKKELSFLPKKPIKSLKFYMLYRKRPGNVLFRNMKLYEIKKVSPVFDGVKVKVTSRKPEGFMLRDIAANGEFRLFVKKKAAGLILNYKISSLSGYKLVEAELSNPKACDRAVTLYYTVPVEGKSIAYWNNILKSRKTDYPIDYIISDNLPVGAGHLSKYPLAAASSADGGHALAFDAHTPAFGRVGYNAATKELFIAWDLSLPPEQPKAKVKFIIYDFDPEWGMRAALAKYYKIYPEAFKSRTPEQGIWMAFQKISSVENYEDFGFKFKEGTNETAWDHKHNFIAFRYTEPMTWWMKAPSGESFKSSKDVMLYLKKLLKSKDEKLRNQAEAVINSAFKNSNGQLINNIIKAPWCDGTVWSMNSMPGIKGKVTDFKLKWNDSIKANLADSKLGGDYTDSSEGYVTAPFDYSREHLKAAATPVTFSSGNLKPGIFKGLIAFEYFRDQRKDILAMNKLMMANSTPHSLWWLMPQVDVAGTETNWTVDGKYTPLAMDTLAYYRSLSGHKPYCFLMNTDFNAFTYEMVDKYMARSVHFGIFPSFFSSNAATGHYFSQPKLYNRDRKLFKKYIPVCKRVAEAGWEPVTLAVSEAKNVYIERFGNNLLTVYNAGTKAVDAGIKLSGKLKARKALELFSGRDYPVNHNKISLTVLPEKLAVLELK